MIARQSCSRRYCLQHVLSHSFIKILGNTPVLVAPGCGSYPWLSHSNLANPTGRVSTTTPLDGQEREMVFLTNNLEWSPRSVADLYRCRWQIEVFFKQIKQTLQLADFLGHNANAVRWQVWMALLVYVLLRYLSYVSKWAHSFTRLFTILRAVLWSKLNLLDLLGCYGTAKGSFRNLARPEQAYFPGFL